MSGLAYRDQLVMGVRKPNAAYVRKDPSKWRRSGWTSAPNSIIRDPDLPPEEVWAWLWLASHDDEFEVSGAKLYESKKSLGRNRAYQLLAALERRGLLLRYHTYDPETRVPYIQYELQPEPVPVDQRTWEPPRAKPRNRGPHPGSRAAREAAGSTTHGSPVDTETPGQQGFPAVREHAGQRPGAEIPGRPGNRSDLDFPGTATMGGVSRQGGSRQGGNPHKEEKTTRENNQPTRHESPSDADAPGVGGLDVDRLDAARTVLAEHESWPRVRGKGQHDKVLRHVAGLLDSGWTQRDLLREWQFPVSEARSAGGLLVSRILNTPPRTSEPLRGQSDVPPWCGRCGRQYPDNRAKVNPRFRLVANPAGDQETPCERCHPSRARTTTAGTPAAS
jgi:hypothetical protein